MAQELLPKIDIVKLHDDVAEALAAVEQLQTRIQKLEARPAGTATTGPGEQATGAEAVELRRQIDALEARIARLEARISAGDESEPDERPSPSLEPAAEAVQDETELYRRALDTFRRRQYAEAKALFEQIVESFPDGTYRQNAYYWTGECEYGLGRYDAATRAFRAALSLPGGAKHDDALLKLGVCYARLGRKSDARRAFKQLLERFPASEYAARAKDYLARL